MQKMLRTCYLMISGATLLLVACHAAVASTIDRSNPETLLKQATSQLLDISKAARGYVDRDRQRYYDQAAGVLDQVIDKEYFARGVMATYASARMYRSLKSDAEREAFKDRVFKFADVLEKVLIEKYADALLAFDGERIDVARIDKGGDHSDRAILMQTIYDKNGKTYHVQYVLHKHKSGHWLINNVIVEGVNLGATYRNQFAEAVENHQGDVDYVVNHWETLMSAQAVKDKAAKDKATKDKGAGQSGGDKPHG